MRMDFVPTAHFECLAAVVATTTTATAEQLTRQQLAMETVAATIIATVKTITTPP